MNILFPYYELNCSGLWKATAGLGEYFIRGILNFSGGKQIFLKNQEDACEN